MLRDVLTDVGHDITTAANGSEALCAVQSADFALVVTDLLMPEKEGLETITELRRSIPGIKIIAMSGGGRIGAYDYLTIAQRLGASQTLAKPFSRGEIIDAINRVLNPPR